MLVAVYGSLKQGFGNNRLLSASVLKGTDQTPPDYTMYSMGGFPCITEEPGTSIHIEVYEIDEEVFQRLDWLEGYPRFYNRKEIDTVYGTAWIYYIKDPDNLGHLNKVVDGEW